jgi:hypothetical protein
MELAKYEQSAVHSIEAALTLQTCSKEHNGANL